MAKPVKVVYKKSLFVELVKRNHNFLYSTRNRENEKYQCYMFELTEELERDIAELNGYKFIEKNYSSSFGICN
ncbi:hypothetical protein [Cytobacillus sp. S13-E01]|uniref:hypothetical protein n=1 Tax=Cytobacillus sp. S13-E01 TaxID=3031326 RepID=UPI0023D82883|nr:hypothetical protein [Cytobacillus sp. S13-E01]